MPDIKIINPDALGKPLGQYSQLTRVKASEYIYIAGQVGVGKDGVRVNAERLGERVEAFRLDREPRGGPMTAEAAEMGRAGGEPGMEVEVGDGASRALPTLAASRDEDDGAMEPLDEP